MNQAFFAPLEGPIDSRPAARDCPALPATAFIDAGVLRVLENSGSGRGFMQEHGLRLDFLPGHATYFQSLNRGRRSALVEEVAEALLQRATQDLPDRLGDLPELAGYRCLAADGHWHQAAVHDARHEGRKMAVGHFYSLDLHSHCLRHLTAARGLHEHDMSALKRIKPTGLRQGVPRGQRVLIVYDKAAVDRAYWHRCRKECAVYFLSCLKENMRYEWIEDRPWEKTDTRNRGLTADRWGITAGGHRLRLIHYTDPVTGQTYEFLTNEKDLPPGVLAELYHRRWEVEKVFDEVKNKLREIKAWVSGLAGKATQARFIALTHNLMTLYEHRLEDRHGVSNEAEDRRRAQRTAQAVKACQRAGTPLTSLLSNAKEATQRSVKFVRRRRSCLRESRTEALAVTRLAHLCAQL